MTEADWLSGTDLSAAAAFAAGRLPERRQRLLAVALCRAAGPLLDHPALLNALAVAERYADEAVGLAEVQRARQACRELALVAYEEYRAAEGRGGEAAPRLQARSALAWAASFATVSPVPVEMVADRVVSAVAQFRGGGSPLLGPPAAARSTAAELLCAAVREVAGNPFRPADFAPWRTDTAVALARQAYAARDFSALPILADALQDAGCDRDDVLAHCRDAALTHARGCWVLDGVLGKG